MNRTPKERLYWLLLLYKNSQIDTETFCNEFHITFDHHLNEHLSDIEYALFKEISVVSARYSGFEEDHLKYPGVYSTSIDVDKAVKLNVELN
ncbi:magnesium and cobalt transport protein CorA [Paenibacillus lutrae]|uniref:Magnesium and cobalt transport protein CorA n=1 Tax=Paenibacillus lutrae TaxID=2078573 RepID=A0A7X3K204_9BACL|nr:magnesium and cobalt transport protein CorA [Paenibacillus lutrae]